MIYTQRKPWRILVVVVVVVVVKRRHIVKVASPVQTRSQDLLRDRENEVD